MNIIKALTSLTCIRLGLSGFEIESIKLTDLAGDRAFIGKSMGYEKNENRIV